MNKILTVNINILKFSLKFQEIPRLDLNLFEIDKRQGSLYSVLNRGKFSSNFELKLVKSKFHEGSKFCQIKLECCSKRI